MIRIAIYFKYSQRVFLKKGKGKLGFLSEMFFATILFFEAKKFMVFKLIVFVPPIVFFRQSSMKDEICTLDGFFSRSGSPR